MLCVKQFIRKVFNDQASRGRSCTAGGVGWRRLALAGALLRPDRSDLAARAPHAADPRAGAGPAAQGID